MASFETGTCYVDDERDIGNSIIVMTKGGFKLGKDFDYDAPHTMGFDKMPQARKAVKSIVPCDCSDCIKEAQTND